MKKIVFYDFDGTLTKRDSMLAFIGFCNGYVSLYFSFLKILPTYLLVALGKRTRQQLKEHLLSIHFKGERKELLEKRAVSFGDRIIPKILRCNKWEELEQFRKDGFEIIIVSASLDLWLAHWCSENQIQLISSIAEFKDNRFTGKLVGENCNGEEKVNRIQQLIELEEYQVIRAFGNSKGDNAMLKLTKG